MRYVAYWLNPATKRRSFAVVVGGSYHWEPETMGGLEAATRWPDKASASAFRRSLGGIKRHVTVAREDQL